MISPLFKKLNLKDRAKLHILNAPESFEPELKTLGSVDLIQDGRGSGEILFFLGFVTQLKEVERFAGMIGKRAMGDAIVWFAYPKQSSKKYKCEFNRDTGWASVGKAGFEGVRQVAIDEDWSAVRFRRAEYIRKMIRDPGRAMTKQGRSKATKGKK